jgi:hypothetical protein
MSVLRTVVALATIVVLLAPLTSCDGDDVTTAPNQMYSVTYSLIIHRSKSTVTSLTYRDSTGVVTVNNPDRRWTIQVSVSGGTTVGMTAQGTVNNGSVEIYLTATDASGTPVYTGEDSRTSGGGAFPFTLEIPETTLGS